MIRDECEHGSLRRACEICERNEEIRRTKEAFQNQMQCVGELKEYLHNAQQMIDALKQQVEDLKCCGNCKLFLRESCPPKEQVDEFQTEFPEPNSVCIAWSSDGKTMEGRQK